MRTIHDDIATVTTLPPATYDTTTPGTAVDTRGYDAVEVLLTLGEYADDSHVLTIEDSSDGQVFTPAAAADIIGDWPDTLDDDTHDEGTIRVGYIGARRYVRVSTAVTGTGTGSPYGAVIVLGLPKQAPVA